MVIENEIQHSRKHPQHGGGPYGIPLSKCIIILRYFWHTHQSIPFPTPFGNTFVNKSRCQYTFSNIDLDVQGGFI